MIRHLLTMGIIAIATTFSAAQPAEKPSLESRWAELASPDEGKAARALLALAALPKETTALLQERLKPVKADSKRVEQLLKQLDSSNFGMRHQAMNELEYLGKYIKTDLEAALKASGAIETKARIQQLIDKMPKVEKAAPPVLPKARPGNNVSVSNINGKITIMIDGVAFDPSKMVAPAPPPGPPAQWVRAARAVTILEHLATAEAEQLLQAIAAGEADALPTIAAREALERLKK